MKLVLPFLFLISASIACAETNAELLEQIQNVIKAEIKEARQSNAPGAEQTAYRLQNLYLQAGRPEFDGNNSDSNLIRNVEAIEAVSTSDKLESLCRTLLKQLRTEREQTENALATEMEKVFAAALESSLSAKTAKDIDQPMRDVMQLTFRGSKYPETSKLRMLNQQGRSLDRFLRELQGYFSAIERHDRSSGQPRMMEVMQATGDLCTLRPRSELLARLAAISAGHEENAIATEAAHWSDERLNEEVRKAVVATHTPAQIDDTLLKLESFAAQPNGARNEFLSTLVQSLHELKRVRVDLEHGLATNIPLPLVSTSASREGDALTDLKSQLLLQAMPRILGLEKSSPVKSDDNLTTYMNRAIAEARGKSDWALVTQIIDFAQTAGVGTALSASDRNALQSFHAGINQERARQYAQAVVSFQAALKAGSPLEFASTIGDQLDAIHKEHPKEYDEGLEIVRTPPAPMMPWGPPRGPAGVLSGLNQAAQPTQPPPSITVPAASSEESTTSKASSPAKPGATKSH